VTSAVSEFEALFSGHVDRRGPRRGWRGRCGAAVLDLGKQVGLGGDPGVRDVGSVCKAGDADRTLN
jgi:hypothetical protein